jgi:hypothetical protein
MGSLSKSAIAVCLILSGICLYSTAAGKVDLRLEPDSDTQSLIAKQMRHPSSREYVAGPWPRFVKKMYA